MRELFCARDKRVWVGWDADSLEAKVEAAYVHRYDSDYAEVLCSGDSSKGTDVHSRNLKAIPLLKDRDQAKTLKYAITYGAQPTRISQILGCTFAEAQDIYDGFWASNAALAKVKQDTLDEWKRNSKKFIHAIDGRRIFTRSEHSLLNAKFQSAGAIIMKYAMVICDKQVRKEKLPAVGLIRYHDEEIYEAVPRCADRVLEIGCESVRIAGEKLNLPVPLSASGCLGQNWAEVH
jgi:DNA polymerase I-like protein with 3'-5' exonuclease and polymerase domains